MDFKRGFFWGSFVITGYCAESEVVEAVNIQILGDFDPRRNIAGSHVIVEHISGSEVGPFENPFFVDIQVGQIPGVPEFIAVTAENMDGDGSFLLIKHPYPDENTIKIGKFGFVV